MVYTRKTIATSISGGGISGKIALQKNGNYEWQLLEKFVNVEELDGVKIPNQGGQLVLERVVDLPDYDTAAAQLKEAFKACVPYYPGNMFKPWSEDGPAPFALLGGIKGTVRGFFGNDDQNPSPDDREKISTELSRLGVEHVFHGYDGAGHAFQNFVAPERFRADATTDSWEKTISYLGSTLKG